MEPETLPPVEYGQIRRLGDLVAAAYNPRKMSPVERDKLKRSLAEFGFVEPVVIRPEDNLIVGGHQRCEGYRDLLRERGLSEAAIADTMVPVAVLPAGVSDTRVQILNLALNKIQGEWDYAKLNDLVRTLSVEVDTPTLELSGFTTLEIKDVLAITGDLPASLTGGGGGGGDSDEDDTPAPAGDAPAPAKDPGLSLALEFASAEEAAEGRAALVQYGMGADPVSSGAALVAMARALQGAAPPAPSKGCKGKSKSPGLDGSDAL